jgi:hypothetical protein
MRARIVIGLAVISLLIGSADCKKKPADRGSGTASEAAKGWIEVKDADFTGHDILDAATGAKVGTSSSTQSVVPVPAGTYDVLFGKMPWKGVVVKANETTVLVPGSLSMTHATLQGHAVVAADNGVVQGTLSSMNSNITLVPGRYKVMFGPLAWPVEVEAGKTTALDPGYLELAGAGVQGHRIYDATGAEVGEVSNSRSTFPLPPGAYTIDLDGKKTPFTIEIGKPTVLKR